MQTCRAYFFVPRPSKHIADHSGLFSLAVFLFVYSLLLCPVLSHAAETLIVQIEINRVNKGEYFVTRDDKGIFSLQTRDLLALGVRLGEIDDGTSVISLDSFEDVTWTFDEQALTLSLHLPATMLPETKFDFSGTRRHDVLFPTDNSAFLNYKLGYSKTADDGFGDGALEFGARRGAALFLSNHQLSYDQDEASQIRLMSSLTYDRRNDLLRAVIGDYQPPPNMFSSGLRLGGISIAKQYEINPYLVRYPLIDLQGSVETPSEIDIYQNGVLLRTERVSPGAFSIEQLNGMSGFGEINLVIRDAYGRETRLTHPYYLTDQLLERGFHEYNYSIGALRRDYGVNDNRYRTLALYAQHRYGYSSNLTLGAYAEAGGDTTMVAPQAVYLIGPKGLFVGHTAFSQSDGVTGQAAGVQYYYNRFPVSTRLGVKVYSESFRTVTISAPAEEKAREFAAGIAWGDMHYGNISADISRTDIYGGESRGRINFGFNRQLGGNLYLSLNLSRTVDNDPVWSLYTTLQFATWDDVQLAMRSDYSRDSHGTTGQIQKNLPFGEGESYHLSIGDNENRAGISQFVDGMFQHNGRRGNYRGEWRLNGDAYGSDHEYDISTSGALVWIDGRFHLSRPVEDSFALVKVGNLSNVSVAQNGQISGRTDRHGEILLPSLNSYYDNQVGIDEQSIPFNYGIHEINRYISPAWRSGSCLFFAASRSQPLTGKIKLLRDNQLLPVEFREVLLRNGINEYRIPTGRGGEFYFDPTEEQFRKQEAAPLSQGGCNTLHDGSATLSTDGYQGEVIMDGGVFRFTLRPPSSDALFIDLGDIVVEESETRNDTASPVENRHVP